MGFNVGGQMVPDSDHATIVGAVDINYVIDSFFRLVPHSDDFVDLFNGAADCGQQVWQSRVVQDVFEIGCSAVGLPPDTVVTDCDFIRVRGDFLFMGAQPVDGRDLNRSALSPHDRYRCRRRVVLHACHAARDRSGPVPLVW